MAEKYFVSGLLLLSFFGSLILLLNRGLDSTVSLVFVGVLAVLALVSLMFIWDTRKSYSLMLVFFLAALIYCAFQFAEGGFGIILWMVTVISLVGFAIAISGPMKMVPKKKAASKKASVAKQLPEEKKPKVTVIKKSKRKKK
ncbi:MAG: hypothetical protein V1702_00550 [Candidatus Woesearchaeota archaeon]